MSTLRRVLMVSEPGEYGVLMYVRSLIDYLARVHPAITVDLAYSTRRDSPPLYELVDQVKARGGATFDMRVGNGPGPGDLAALRGIRAMIRDHRPDLVHAHSSKAGALMRFNRLLPGSPPMLYSPHGYYGMSRRGGMKDVLFNGIETTLGPIGWTHNVSWYERKFAREKLRLGRRAVLVISGIDLATFHPATPEQRTAARAELGLPADGKLLVTVGRDAYEKNFGELYAALGLALSRRDGWSFAHAGQNSAALAATLPPEVRGRVTTFDFLNQPVRLLHAADGFIMTSRSEAFGLAAVEALACGLPLILTSATGLLSLARLGFPAIHWLPDPVTAGPDPERMADAILAWAETPAGQESAQAERAAHWFNRDVQFGKLVRLYGHLTSR